LSGLAIYDFCTELLSTRQVSDANIKNMVERFGERGVVETVGLMGHFHTLTMLFVVNKYPVPEGPTPSRRRCRPSPPFPPPLAGES
jgi:4-carboxymuconolactone decarboxylase